MPSSSPCFSVPASSDLHEESDVNILTNINSPLSPVTKIQGKMHKSAVNGTLSIATILSNAFLLPGFPRSSYAIIQSGQLGLTFAQIDVISKRLALVISSLVIFPGSDYQVRTNNDGDSVIMIILNEEDYVDEQLVVLIFTILRLGAAYTIVHKSELSADVKYWSQLMTLIEPILVITLLDPKDMPTSIRNDLNLVAREHFEDFQEEEDYLNDNMMMEASQSSSMTDASSPIAVSSALVKKLQSSLTIKPVTYKPCAISSKIIWDVGMELRVSNEKDLQVIHFRSETQMGQRTAFIFPCIPPFQGGYGYQWCRLGHKAIRNRIAWERMEFPMKPSEKVCLTFPLQDPRSLMQIFNSFIHGKALILGESGEFHNGGFFLRKFRSEYFRNVLRIELTPERLQELLDTASQTGMEAHLGKIKMWIVSSSAGLVPSLAKQFFHVMKGAGDVSLVVTYGKAECLWCATAKVFQNNTDVVRSTIVEKEGVSRLTMGVPVANTTVYVVDERKNTFCGMGQRGQIWVAGCMVPSGGYCGGPVLGRCMNQIFPLGDQGKIVQDKNGNLQLVVENDSEYPVLFKGRMLDLEDISKQIRQDQKLARDAYAFICKRGRDVPEIVVAVVPFDPAKLSGIQDRLSEVDPSLNATYFPLTVIPKSSDGMVDIKQLRAAYFKFLGKCSPRQWNILIPSKSNEKGKNSTDDDIEKNIQVICKAVAFSLGLSLTKVIENYDKSFWEIGGTSLRAIITVKSCLCQGKKLSIEDFVVANRISELGFRLILAEKEDLTWNQEISLIRQSFIYSRMTRSDYKEIFEILVANLKKIPGSNEKNMEKYAQGLLETFDNSLSVVGLTSEVREIVGVALNYRGGVKFHFVPPKLEEGVELFTSVINSCKHMTQGIDNKNLAKSYVIVLKTSATHQVISAAQSMLLIRDLIREGIQNAESAGCKGFMVCTVDPVVQEVCCSLLGFEMLTEVQLNLYKNKKLQKPFIHMDDHQVIGVYFRKIMEQGQ